MLIYDVDSLDSAAALLKTRGWTPVAERIDIPNGPCTTFDDPTGNHLAIFEDQHPDKMTLAYADPANSSAVRD
jgi:predicted enzyme related to lactoylglutathione lyase